MKLFKVIILFILFEGVSICEAQPVSSCKINYQSLLRGMNAHERGLFKEFVKCRSHYDGGNLEDLYRASGLYLEANPDEYLEVLSDFNITKREMENFLLMLPLSTVDNIDLNKAEINKRIHLIKLAKDSKVKADALEILKNELVFLTSIKSLN